MNILFNVIVIIIERKLSAWKKKQARTMVRFVYTFKTWHDNLLHIKNRLLRLSTSGILIAKLNINWSFSDIGWFDPKNLTDFEKKNRSA